jgi:hypothetical protein
MNRKSILAIGLLSLGVFALSSCGGSNETTQEEEQEGVEQKEEFVKVDVGEQEFKAILTAYLELSSAFVKTDEVLAKEKALALSEAITSTGDPFDGIKNHADQISELDLIEKQREHFKPMSESMLRLSKGNSDDLFMHYCSMAFDNEGANWISNDEEVLNPYFGDVMLHCGSTKKLE